MPECDEATTRGIVASSTRMKKEIYDQRLMQLYLVKEGFAQEPHNRDHRKKAQKSEPR